jgi:hypothetical protein
MPAPETTIGQFPRKFVTRFFLAGLVIVSFFMGLKLLRYEMISQSQADQIIAWVKPVWPVLASQYSWAEDADPLGSRYYALVVVAALVTLASMYLYAVCRYYVEREYIRMPVRPEFVASAIAPFVYVYFSWFDVPNTGTHGGFWVDSFGTYYIRQYVVFFGVGMLILFFLLVMLRVMDELWRRLQGAKL